MRRVAVAKITITYFFIAFWNNIVRGTQTFPGTEDELKRRGHQTSHLELHSFLPPASSSTSKGHVTDYYVALGSHGAIPDELKDHRVGGNGRLHIFHLPKTLSFFQIRSNSSHRGGRRSSLSSLMPLTHKSQLIDTFPSYTLDPTYTNPLNSRGQEIESSAVQKLTKDMVMDYLVKITTLPSRSWQDVRASNAAVDLIQNELNALKLPGSICLQHFEEDGEPLTNVIAHIPGTTSDSIVVGAHYDSRPFTGAAPGAEDNGSGIAALLSIARAYALSGAKPVSSIYFVAFAGEEAGCYGSKYFADALATGSGMPRDCKIGTSFLQGRNRKTGVHRAIILDEVGWLSPKLAPSHVVNLESFDDSQDVLEHLAQASSTHNGEALTMVHNSRPFGSDHMSFLNNGMHAVLTINGDDDGYPNYHKSTDTLPNVDPAFVVEISKMNMGGLMRMSGIRQ